MPATPLIWLYFLGFFAVILSPFVVRSIFRIRQARAALRETRERMMRDARLCVNCGYDVRVNAGKCPECGAEIAAVDG
jgi:predicted Zn-ribbon and HTH transcriptional regulator